MLRRNSFLFLVSSIYFIATTVFASATIITAQRFTTVRQLIQQNKHPHRVLLALDDDDTLTMMPCPSSAHCQYLGGPAWFAWQSKLPPRHPQRVWKTFPELLNIADALYLMSHMTLVDPAIPSTLKIADHLGVSILVVTDRGYRMIYPTERQFQQNHILSWIEKGALKTPDGRTSFPSFYFPVRWNDKKPNRIAYTHGVLYVAGQNKGNMIQQFLQKTHHNKKITTIIFVDDTFKNIKDVADVYKKDPRVHAICVYYTKLAAHKAAFLTGKHAKQLQASATQQWRAIHTALQNNLIDFSLQ